MDRGCILPVCCIALVVFSAITVGQDSFAMLKVEIHPPNPLVKSGGTLELYCTLIGSSNPADYSLCFRFDKRLNDTFVTRLNDTTARLRWPNVLRNYSLGHVFCNICHAQDIFTSISITVADPPAKPNITLCFVRNWKYMNCSWTPQKYETGFSQKLYYTPHLRAEGDGEADVVRILDNHASSHEWAFPYIDMSTWVRIVATNAVGEEASDWKHFNIQNLIKPNSVSDLNSTNVTSNSVIISWSAPDRDSAPDQELHLVAYRANFTSEWKIATHYLNSTLRVSLMEVSQLIPATRYNVTVEGIPIVGTQNKTLGFWSDATFLQFKTLSDVPGALPVVVAFYDFDQIHTATHRDVVIFIQPVSRFQSHGQVHTTRVRYGPLHSAHYMEKNFPGNVTQAKLTGLDIDTTYEIKVEIATDKGFNESLVITNPLRVFERNYAQRKPDNFVALYNQSHTVELRWTAVNGAAGYTVYWCETAVRDPCKPGASLQSVSISAGTNQTLLRPKTDRPFHDYSFAISTKIVANISASHIESSVERDTSSNHKQRRNAQEVIEVIADSTIVWSECTFNIANKPAKPKDVKFDEGRQQHRSLTVKWTKPDCQSQTGYIQQFMVVYCRQSDDAGCISGGKIKDGSQRIIVEAHATAVVLRDLDPGDVYTVQVKSLSFLSESNFTAPIQATVSGLTRGAVVGIVVACIVALILLVIGVISILRKGGHRFRKYACLDIALPEQSDNMPMHQSTSNGYTAPPQLGTRVPVERESRVLLETFNPMNTERLPLEEEEPSEDDCLIDSASDIGLNSSVRHCRSPPTGLGSFPPPSTPMDSAISEYPKIHSVSVGVIRPDVQNDQVPIGVVTPVISNTTERDNIDNDIECDRLGEDLRKPFGPISAYTTTDQMTSRFVPLDNSLSNNNALASISPYSQIDRVRSELPINQDDTNESPNLLQQSVNARYDMTELSTNHEQSLDPHLSPPLLDSKLAAAVENSECDEKWLSSDRGCLIAPDVGTRTDCFIASRVKESYANDISDNQPDGQSVSFLATICGSDTIASAGTKDEDEQLHNIPLVAVEAVSPTAQAYVLWPPPGQSSATVT